MIRRPTIRPRLCRAHTTDDEDAAYERRRDKHLAKDDDEDIEDDDDDEPKIDDEDYAKWQRELEDDEDAFDKDDDDDIPATKKSSAVVTWRPGHTLRLTDGRWTPQFRDVFLSQEFIAMSWPAQMLVHALHLQWGGFGKRNVNGRLVASMSRMRQRHGWKNSPATLRRAISEAIKAGFLRQTRKARTKPPHLLEALYALTWVAEGKAKHGGKT